MVSPVHVCTPHHVVQWGVGGGGGGHATQWRLRAVFEMAPYQSAMAWLRGSYLNGVHLYS